MATVFIQKHKGRNRTSYAVRYKDPQSGKNRYYKSFQRQKDAAQAANDLRALLESGKVSKIEDNRAKLHVLTFAEAADLLRAKWREDYSENRIREKTFKEYFYWLRALQGIFGNKLMNEIRSDDIDRFRKRICSSLSVITFNRYLFVLKQVFKQSIEAKAIIENVVADTKYLSEKAHERKRFLMPEEIERLIEASRKTQAKHYLPALICLGAEHGTSRQEALSLRWSDVNFEYQGKGLIRFFRTKTGLERTEFLMPRTRQTLLEWRNHLKSTRQKNGIRMSESSYVFCRQGGTPIKRFDKAWRGACFHANIDSLHYHDLRHTFCSNLLLSGADLKEVKDMIGHRDLAMTDRYSHLTAAHKLKRQMSLAEHYAQGEVSSSS